MNEEMIYKIDLCRHLLSPPGAEVVGECIEEIRRLNEENQHLKDTINILRKSVEEE